MIITWRDDGGATVDLNLIELGWLRGLLRKVKPEPAPGPIETFREALLSERLPAIESLKPLDDESFL